MERGFGTSDFVKRVLDKFEEENPGEDQAGDAAKAAVNAAMNKAVVDRAWTDAEGKVKMTPSPGSSRPRASCSTTTASCATCLAAAPPSRSCTSPTRRRPLH